MSTEFAQEEDDADGRDEEAYDLESMERGALVKGDTNAEGGIRLQNRFEHLWGRVVFETSDEYYQHSSLRRGRFEHERRYECQQLQFTEFEKASTSRKVSCAT
jgi:hypothetical protein